ncbi:MAG: hypothetical protein QXF70_03420 [Candidatus Bilamarchaeaceae archaeon]
MFSNKRKVKDYPAEICKALSLFGIEHKREYKFHNARKFRFDIAIPQYRIAIEFEGGVFSNGRHVRGAGYISDCRKYNLAVLNGWRLLRYTTADTRKKNWEYNIVSDVEELIGGLNGKTNKNRT